MDFEWTFCMDWSQGDKLKSITSDTGWLSIMDACIFFFLVRSHAVTLVKVMSQALD